MTPRPFRVTRVRRETRDTVTLTLEAADGSPLAFAPGQFNMLYLFGVGEVPISISGDPERPERLVHTIRAVGTVTRAICASKPGATLGVRGPFGSAWPVREAEGADVVVVAGGLGLAPVRPILYHLLSHRERYGRVVLLAGARTPGDLLFATELEKWRGHFDLDVEVSVDAATREWRGNVGVVTGLFPRVQFTPSEAVAMVCGPEVMMRFTTMELLRRGMSAERIYLSMERNMKCAVGLCGHCQLGPTFVCKDGPVFQYDRLEPLLQVREL